MRLLLSAALLIGQAGFVGGPPLAPASPWNVEYAAKECVVSRAYGDSADPILIGFRPTPFGDNVRLVIFGDRALLGEEGWVDLTLEAPGSALSNDHFETKINSTSDNKVVMNFYISRTEFEYLVNAQTFTFRQKSGQVTSVVLAMNKSLLVAISKCGANLMAQFGFDAKKIASVATRAVGESPNLWIDTHNYPAVSLTKHEEGTVMIAWAISAAGRVSNCRVIETSGSKDLDEAACDAILRNARYRSPALDAAGNPVESYVTRRVAWRLPRRG